MKLTDIIALAKAGYSVSDVKELMNLASSEDKDPEPQDEPKDEKTEEPKTGKDTASTEPEKSTEAPEKVIAIDEYRKQIEELEKQVKDLQQKNIHKDVSSNQNEKTDKEIMDDITRSFM